MDSSALHPLTISDLAADQPVPCRCLHTRCCDDGSDEDLSQESISSDAHSISSSSAGSDEDKAGSIHSTFAARSVLTGPVFGLCACPPCIQP